RPCPSPDAAMGPGRHQHGRLVASSAGEKIRRLRRLRHGGRRQQGGPDTRGFGEFLTWFAAKRKLQAAYGAPVFNVASLTPFSNSLLVGALLRRNLSSSSALALSLSTSMSRSVFLATVTNALT